MYKSMKAHHPPVIYDLYCGYEKSMHTCPIAQLSTVGDPSAERLWSYGKIVKFKFYCKIIKLAYHAILAHPAVQMWWGAPQEKWRNIWILEERPVKF